jgi:TfoX/Sxy family transcriptional regulator of competence genes
MLKNFHGESIRHKKLLAIVIPCKRMQWKKPSPELMEYQASIMGSFAAEKKKMFGSTVYFSNGNMFTGVHEDNIFLRLSGKDRSELAAKYAEAVQFEPLKGRPMKEYMNIPPRLYRDADAFKQWLGLSLKYANSLPSKAAKAKK